MSPLGLPHCPDRLTVDKLKEEVYKNGSYLEKVGFDTMDWIWNEAHPGPFELSRMAGQFALPVIRKSLKRRLKTMDEETINIFAKYVH